MGELLIAKVFVMGKSLSFQGGTKKFDDEQK